MQAILTLNTTWVFSTMTGSLSAKTIAKRLDGFARLLRMAMTQQPIGWGNVTCMAEACHGTKKRGFT